MAVGNRTIPADILFLFTCKNVYAGALPEINTFLGSSEKKSIFISYRDFGLYCTERIWETECDSRSINNAPTLCEIINCFFIILISVTRSQLLSYSWTFLQGASIPTELNFKVQIAKDFYEPNAMHIT